MKTTQLTFGLSIFKNHRDLFYKSFLVIFIFFLGTIPAVSQNTDSKFSAEISFGASFPVGKFADKSNYQDTGSYLPGWAKTGPAIQLSFDYQIKKSYGLSLVFGGQENIQDANSLIDNYKRYAHNLSDSIYYEANVQHWQIGKILAGGFITMPLAKSGNLFLRPKLLIGALKTSVPGYSVSVYQIMNGAYYPSAYGSVIPYSLNYKLNSRIYLTANLNYFHASPSRSYTLYSFATSPPSSKYYDVQYPISSFNLMIGAGFKF
jgi:hypothetical protein